MSTTTDSRKRILLVDDSRDVAWVFCRLLTSIGYRCTTAHDGHEAVALAASFCPDLILMDIQMPRMDGFEACRLIRELPGGKSIVILACTAVAEPLSAQLAAAAFDAVMAKPLKFSELTASLTAALQGA